MADKVESRVIMVAMCSVPELEEKKTEAADGKKLKELLNKKGQKDEEGRDSGVKWTNE